MGHLPQRSSVAAFLIPLVVAGLIGCAGLAQSSGPSALAIMPGVINRPDNKSLRFAMK